MAVGTLTGPLTTMCQEMCVSVEIAEEVPPPGVALREEKQFFRSRNKLLLPQVSDDAGLRRRLSVNGLLFLPALLQKRLLHLPPPLPPPPHLSL